MTMTFVGELISRDIKTAYPAESATAVAERLCIHDVDALLIVTSDDTLDGIVTSKDIVEIVANGRSTSTPVREYMTQDVVTAHPSEPIQDAATLLVEHNIHHLPVVTPNNKVLGILSSSDLAKYVSETELAKSSK